MSGNLNHIAVSVTTNEEVIKYYTKVLGFVVKPPFEEIADDTYIGKILQVFGKTFEKSKISFKLW
jgi:hypothetical protein